MGSTPVAGRAAARADSPRMDRGVIRWLYCNNPFYVLSAALVFFGLRASFGGGARPFETGMLMVGLAGYALLLSATAWALIRLGQVWDDVRTVLLLVVMMFLAISVSFDYTLVEHPALGLACTLGGLGFAVAVSEALLRGIGLRLPALFRVPYHLALGLFFLYPIGLARLSVRPESAELQWALFGFSTAAGLVSLTLLPAIRRGPAYVAKNGSPWGWPLYPWVLFGLLGLGVLARSYSICVSFHFVLKSRSIFGPYVLVPFLLAVSVLLLEIGLRARRAALVRLAIASPFLLVALAMTGHRLDDPVYAGFLRRFTEVLGGTPAYVTLLALGLVYGLASIRRAPTAPEALAFCLAGFAWIGPETLGPTDLAGPRAWPLAVSGAVLALRAGRLRDPVRGALAAGMLGMGSWIALPDHLGGFQRAALFVEAATVLALLLGALLSDPRYRLACQRVGLTLLGLLGLWALALDLGALQAVPEPLSRWLPPAAAVMAWAYGEMVLSVFGRRVGILLSVLWLLESGRRGYLALRESVAGLDQIALGLAFFAVAVAISLVKAGVLHRLVRGDPGKAEYRQGVDLP